MTRGFFFFPFFFFSCLCNLQREIKQRRGNDLGPSPQFENRVDASPAPCSIVSRSIGRRVVRGRRTTTGMSRAVSQLWEMRKAKDPVQPQCLRRRSVVLETRRTCCCPMSCILPSRYRGDIKKQIWCLSQSRLDFEALQSN